MVMLFLACWVTDGEVDGYVDKYETLKNGSDSGVTIDSDSGMTMKPTV